MSDTTFRPARLGEDAAIIDFINANFDMRLPLLNRPELYHHYYAGRGGVPQFAVAEQDGEYVSAAGVHTGQHKAQAGHLGQRLGRGQKPQRRGVGIDERPARAFECRRRRLQ